MPDSTTNELSIPLEVKLSEELRRALKIGSPINNYVVDIAGEKGIQNRAPSITNLPNTLTVSSHGLQGRGFSPDASATNDLSKVVNERLKEGKRLSLEDIAGNLGSATNEIKRAIIGACFASGYNFDSVKQLFPNLEELIAPSTSHPTSAWHYRDLTRPVDYPGSELEKISPLFRVTPTSTNVVRKASDWLNDAERNNVEIPLSQEESKWDSVLKGGNFKRVWSPEKYSNRYYALGEKSDYEKKLDAILEWQREQFKKKERFSDKDFEEITAEVKRRFDAAGTE